MALRDVEVSYEHVVLRRTCLQLYLTEQQHVLTFFFPPPLSQNNIERIVTEAYSELEASVVRFLKSVDELAASENDEAAEHENLGSIDASSSCSQSSSHNHRDTTTTTTEGNACTPIDLPILTIRSLAASQSRELWTTTTGVIERVLQVVRTSLPDIVDGIERNSDVRHRKQKERHRRSLEAARISCRKDWQGRLARNDREWQAKTNRAEMEHNGALRDMETRAESAESSRRVLSSKLDLAEETIQRIEYELTKTRSELIQSVKDKEEITTRLNGEVAEAEQKEQRAQEELSNCRNKLRNAEARYEAKVQKLSDTKEELREIRQELRTRTKDLASLRTKYREKEDECRYAQKRTNDLESSLQFVGRPSPSKVVVPNAHKQQE